MQNITGLLDILLSDYVMQYVVAFVVGGARIVALLGFAPFFGAQVTGVMRLSLALAFYFPVHPLIVSQLNALGGAQSLSMVTIALVTAKEVALGGMMGIIAGIFFWASQAAGTIIDNQRGASQAMGSGILTGEETSPFGSVLFLSMVNIFYSSGAVLAFMMLLYESYDLWPVFHAMPALAEARLGLFFGAEVNHLMTQALLLCGPFVLVALMSDMSLGIINRFAPQLNVFVLSMAIKSGLCAMLIVFYIIPFTEIAASMLDMMRGMLRELFEILKP